MRVACAGFTFRVFYVCVCVCVLNSVTLSSPFVLPVYMALSHFPSLQHPPTRRPSSSAEGGTETAEHAVPKTSWSRWWWWLVAHSNEKKTAKKDKKIDRAEGGGLAGVTVWWMGGERREDV